MQRNWTYDQLQKLNDDEFFRIFNTAWYRIIATDEQLDILAERDAKIRWPNREER